MPFVHSDGRTDGWHVDWLFQSFSSFGSQVRSSNNFFFFFFSRKNKTKQKTNWLYTQGAAGNTRRVRQSQVHTHHDDFVRSECTLNKTAAPTFTRIGWLVCPLCIYRYIYLYMYVCIEGRERERGRNISALHAKLKKRNRRRDRMGAGYWWGGERTSRCGARCCLDVATKHKPANHHHLFPSTKRESFSLFFFVSVCVSSLFFFKKKKNSYKDVAAASAAAEVMGDSVLLLSHIIQQTHFSLSEMSRSYIRYDQKTDDLSVVTCHFGYFKQRQHTNTHTHTRTHTEIDCQLYSAGTHLRTLSVYERMTLGKMVKDGSLSRVMWRRDILFCHPTVVIVTFTYAYRTILYVYNNSFRIWDGGNWDLTFLQLWLDYCCCTTKHFADVIVKWVRLEWLTRLGASRSFE